MMKPAPTPISPTLAQLIEPKLRVLGSGRIIVSAMIALLAILNGCARSADQRREAFMETRAEVIVAAEPETVEQLAGWPWSDINADLARAADAGAHWPGPE